MKLSLKQTRWQHMLVGTVLLFTLAGCSLRPPEKIEDIDLKSPACGALTTLRDGAAGLAAVDANTRVEDLRARKQGVDRLAEALRRANEVLQSEQISGALSSYANLSQTIDGAMNQPTLGDAAVAVQTGANGIVAALDEARAGIGCGQ